MSRTLLVVTILMLGFSSLAQMNQVDAQSAAQSAKDTEFILFSPAASAQTPEPQESGGRFYLTIVGDPPPNEAFGLSYGVCYEDCTLSLTLHLFCHPDDPCRSGETYEIVVGTAPMIEFQYFRGTVDESGSNAIFPKRLEYFNDSGGIVPLDQDYSATYTYPTEEAPLAEPSMPEAPPEVGGGGMSGQRTPPAPPARWAIGGSSIAYRR